MPIASSYTYVQALVLKKGLVKSWETLDVSNIPVKILYTDFLKVLVTVTNTATTIKFDLDDLRSLYNTYEGNIIDMLQLVSPANITPSAIPTNKVDHIHYGNAIQLNYNFSKAPIAKDLLIKRDGLNYIHSHTLISVNGFYHMTDMIDLDTVSIKDADTTLSLSNTSNIGITSFMDIGALTKVKIIPSMISPITTPNLMDGIQFTYNGSLTGKTVLLILGGYLIMTEPGVFWKSGNNTFNLNLNNLSYIERLTESSNYIDLSSLNTNLLTQPLTNAEIAFLTSNNSITNYLTLSQSFLVIIDSPMLLDSQLYLRDTSHLGELKIYQTPDFLLKSNFGKVIEYWKSYDNELWCVTILDNLLRNDINNGKKMIMSDIIAFK